MALELLNEAFEGDEKDDSDQEFEPANKKVITIIDESSP